MQIFVDSNEPGAIAQDLARRGLAAGFRVERTMLHKRVGLGGALRERHPLYGLGADFIVTDHGGEPVAAIERKTLEDLAKSATIRDPRVPEGSKLFRQLRDLLALPMPTLILEGQPSLLYRRAEPAMLGLQWWCAREGIAVVYSTGPLSTSHAVVLLASRFRRELGRADAQPSGCRTVAGAEASDVEVFGSGPRPFPASIKQLPSVERA